MVSHSRNFPDLGVGLRDSNLLQQVPYTRIDFSSLTDFGNQL
jgi:hypothetical protein